MPPRDFRSDLTRTGKRDLTRQVYRPRWTIFCWPTGQLTPMN